MQLYIDYLVRFPPSPLERRRGGGGGGGGGTVNRPPRPMLPALPPIAAAARRGQANPGCCRWRWGLLPLPRAHLGAVAPGTADLHVPVRGLFAGRGAVLVRRPPAKGGL
jgi:hypothetical protein